MNILQRILNAACLVTLRIMHWIMISGYLQPVLRKYLGELIFHANFVYVSIMPPRLIDSVGVSYDPPPFIGDQLPDVRDLTREIPLTLQNSHYSVADSVPYLANVVNVACLHCKPATHLSPDLETFLQRGERKAKLRKFSSV